MSGGYRRYLAIVLAVFLNVVSSFGLPASAASDLGARNVRNVGQANYKQAPHTSKMRMVAQPIARNGHLRHPSVPNTRYGVHGAGVIRDFTADRMGDYLTVFYEGRLLTSPVTQDAIPNSNRTGALSVLAQSRQAADMLHAGDVSVVFKVVMTRD